MKRVQKPSGVCWLIIFCWLATTLFVFGSEPSYNGRPLSEWLLLNSNPSLAEQILSNGTPSPAGAVREIGTNGIPTMMSILSVKKSDKWLVLMKLKSPLVKKLFRGDENVDDLRQLAVDGFGVLGTNAESAVPQLTMLFHSYDRETFFQTVQALSEVGPAGFATLTNAMNDPDASVRNNLIWVIGEKGGGNSNVVTRLLIQALKDPSPANRGNAAEFLAGRNPQEVIPALIPLLDDNEYYPLIHAARTLGSYGALAKSAAPKLLSIYTNKVVNTDQHEARSWGVELMWAIKPIDTDTAEQAENFLINSGPLNYARYGYTETLLPNGKELISGGYIHTDLPTIRNRTLASAELLDPTTGKWTETGRLNFARCGHRATLLPDGKVLIEGGYGPGGVGQPPVLSSKELYDPDTGIWTVTANK